MPSKKSLTAIALAITTAGCDMKKEEVFKEASADQYAYVARAMGVCPILKDKVRETMKDGILDVSEVEGIRRKHGDSINARRRGEARNEVLAQAGMKPRPLPPQCGDETQQISDDKAR